MSSAFFGIETALRALRTQQGLVDIANHNIANANTPGFSRQVGLVNPTSPFPAPGQTAVGTPGQVGSGVEISGINRIRDLFNDFQMRNELASQAKWDARADILDQVEAIFNEPSPNGLSSLMNEFWNGAQELANSPADASVRASLVQQGKAVTDAFHRTRELLTQFQRDLDVEVDLTVQDINDYAVRIADVNQQVVQAEVMGLRANDLRDQRDLMLDELSKLAKVTYVESSDGAVSVYLDGSQLVDRSTANLLEAAPIPGEEFLTVRWAGGGQRVSFVDGKMTGVLEARDEVVGGRIAELDAFAARLIEDVNAVHVSGLGLDGSGGIEFFTGTDARTIEVNTVIENDLNKIAAARQPATPGDPVAAGDARNALALAALQRTVTQGISTSTLLPGATVDSGNVAVVGVDVSTAPPGTTFTFAAAGSTLTISDGTTSVPVTIAATDVEAGDVFVIDAGAIGLRITLSASANGTPANVVAGLAGLTLSTDPSSTSLGDQYGAQIAALGVDARAARGQSANQEVLVTNLERRRASVSGVSLDEETANLIRYQHAYQAAARVMSTMDSMLDTLINGMIR